MDAMSGLSFLGGRKPEGEGYPALPGGGQMFLNHTGAFIGMNEAVGTPTAIFARKNAAMLGNRPRPHAKQNNVAGAGIGYIQLDHRHPGGFSQNLDGAGFSPIAAVRRYWHRLRSDNIAPNPTQQAEAITANPAN
jgi:hypothetical protein